MHVSLSVSDYVSLCIYFECTPVSAPAIVVTMTHLRHAVVSSRPSGAPVLLLMIGLPFWDGEYQKRGQWNCGTLRDIIAVE